ncbi:MAG: YlbF family regulator [Lachnospiraceae bacterium]|nr:YlbF family regulator [Lachnospiraceae bacterium]
MDKIDNALQQLIAAILASDVYSRYDVQRIRVNSMPELKAQIDEFRRKNLELQTNEHTTLEQIDSFERENAQFRENPVVDEFLAAELAFCRLIQELNLRLIDALHFE